MIKEDLLHFMWKSHLIPKHGLKTTNGQRIDVLHSGVLNHENGPDFLLSRIRIDGFLWAGSIEMHVKASDWYTHGHQHDKRYDNVILHVVLENDKPVKNATGVIPCVELKSFLTPQLRQRYSDLQTSHFSVPCFRYDIPSISEELGWMRDRLLAERLSRKLTFFATNNCSDHVAFRKMLFVSMGGRKNKDAFLRLAELINWAQIDRWYGRPELISAYVMRVSGLFKEELAGEGLSSQIESYISIFMNEESWSTRGIRPKNQPRVRILQLIDIINRGVLLNLPSAETATDYSLLWQEELYRLKTEINCSQFLISTIAINCIVPFAFSRGAKYGDSAWIDFAFDHLEQWRPEKNAIVDLYKKKGVVTKSAADSQAILELNSYYCKRKKCVNCSVGTKLMRA